jgi:hypothetical protein
MKVKTKLLAILFTIFLVQMSVCTAFTYKGKAKYENFPDVIGTKYEDAALYLKAFGYSSGYPDGTYKPLNNITRAELVTLAIAFSSDAQDIIDSGEEIDSSFSDISGHWAERNIKIAAKVGIVSGYQDGTFRPNNLVTHTEALAMLINVHGLKSDVSKWNYSWPENYILYSISKGYSDMSDIDEYSENANRGDIANYIANIRDVKWE